MAMIPGAQLRHTLSYNYKMGSAYLVMASLPLHHRSTEVLVSSLSTFESEISYSAGYRTVTHSL